MPLHDAALFTFGQNALCELALGDRTERWTPMRVAVEEAVVDVACGNEHTLLLRDSGRVDVCGNNASGQCGQVELPGGYAGAETEPLLVVNIPRPLRGLDSLRVERVVAGNGCEHVALLCASGKLFMLGCNSRGQLGIGTTEDAHIPTQMRGLGDADHVVDVACSFVHTMVVTMEGALFGCGGNECGQLGLGDTVDRSMPTRVTSLHAHGASARLVACGRSHTIICSGENSVWACGKNDRGQLGIGIHSIAEQVPTRIGTPLYQADIASVSCGYDHSVVVTETGAVFTFGRNQFGQLGLGHRKDVATPVLVQALARRRISQVACGAFHTLALSDDGLVFPFGRNNHGQLGVESTVDCVTPQIVASLRHMIVCKVAAGFYHSACLAFDRDHTASPAETGIATLSTDLRGLLRDTSRSDVVFVVQGQRVHAHSCILGARCEPFDKMLDGRTNDRQAQEIEISECSLDAFTAMLEFIYTDSVTALDEDSVDPQFMLDLMETADRFLLPRLWSMCEAEVPRFFDPANVCAFLQLSHLRSSASLKRKCVTFIVDNFPAVAASEGFDDLSPSLKQEVQWMATRDSARKS